MQPGSVALCVIEISEGAPGYQFLLSTFFGIGEKHLYSLAFVEAYFSRPLVLVALFSYPFLLPFQADPLSSSTHAIFSRREVIVNMRPSLVLNVAFILFSGYCVYGQSAISTTGGSGYTGYNLTVDGSPEDTDYSTLDTPSSVSTTNPPPDIYLNASVHVGEIDIVVKNLTAQINLQATVLSLLNFNAGVDLSIDRVSLTIQNVTAKVLLEARLENLVLMIGTILDSLDLNPALATLGTDLVNITNTTVGALESPSIQSRGVPISYDLAHNVLYSTNNYQGNTHSNRILTQTGTIVDQFLDNDGNIKSTQTVGYYLKDMTFNGENTSAVIHGQPVWKLEYVYQPFVGLIVVSNIYVNDTGTVMATQVLSELSGGGSSTIGD